MIFLKIFYAEINGGLDYLLIFFFFKKKKKKKDKK